MSKKRKVWSIIAIVFGGLTVIGSIANLKEYWFSLIVGLGLVALGVWLLVSGKKKAQVKQPEQRPAPKPAPIVSQDGEKKELVFTATYVEKYQDRLARIDEYKVFDIKPYQGYEGSTRYSVTADDLKIGEAPARLFAALDAIIGNFPMTVEVSRTSVEGGYGAEVKVTYWK